LCLVPVLLCGTVGAQDFLKDRARWEYTDPKTKEKHTLTGWVTGELTVGKGATVKDRKHIGTWSSPGPDEIVLKVNDGHRLAGASRVQIGPVEVELDQMRVGREVVLAEVDVVAVVDPMACRSDLAPVDRLTWRLGARSTPTPPSSGSTTPSGFGARPRIMSRS
jgi:hypothetical protein